MSLLGGFIDSARSFLSGAAKPPRDFFEGVVVLDKKAYHLEKQQPGKYLKKYLSFDADAQPDLPLWTDFQQLQTFNLKLQDFHSYHSAYKIISPLYRAVKLISNEITGRDSGLYNAAGDKLEEKDLIKDPTLSFFNNSEVTDDFDEFQKLCLLDFLLTGNVYVLKDSKLMSTQFPTRFRRLNAKYVSIKTDNQGLLLAYRYQVLGDFLEIPPEMIIHIKYAPNPLFPAYGIGPVEANEKLMQHYLSLNAWKIHFFAGMVAPSAVLEQSALIKDILFTPEDLERMTNKFNSYAAGKLGAGKAVMAPPGFNVKPWGSVPDLKGFNEEYMITTKEIYRVLGIPQYLSQLDEKDVPKFDNVYVQREDWQTNTIAPIIKTFSVLFNKILLAIGRADDLFFSYEDRITYDPARIRADMQAGILSPWQAMQYGGYDTSIISPAEEPSLKTHFMPSTMVPIEDLVYGWSTAGIATTPGSNAHTPASPAAPAVPSTPATPAPDTPAPSPNEKKSLHAGCTCHADKPVKVKYQQRLKSWRDNNSGGWRSRPAREVWRKGEARNQARNIAEDMLRLMRASLRKRYPITQKTYKDFLDGQNKRIKAGLEEEGYQKLLAHYEPLKSLGAGVNISKAGHDAFNAAVRAYVINTLDEDKENSLLVATTKEAYESITNSCIKNTESCLTISIEPEDVAGIISKVQLVGADRAPKVNETTLARMEREIRNSVRDGETYQEMSANLEDKFSQLSQYRSEMIARTELSKAYEKASIGAMESSGVVKTYEVYGCNPECSGWDCNRTDIEPHEVDDLDFHPNHTGAVVPQEYQADFGED